MHFINKGIEQSLKIFRNFMQSSNRDKTLHIVKYNAKDTCLQVKLFTNEKIVLKGSILNKEHYIALTEVK